MEVSVCWAGLEFYYKGDIKSALKARRKGIESSLLRLSFRLLDEVKGKRADAIILDIGSSFGFLSTVWALSAARNGKVVGFEASPDVYMTACETQMRNRLENLSYYNNAVYNVDGEVTLAIFDGTRAEISEDKLHGISVPSLALDTFTKSADIGRVDLIKIDVDGSELEVLLGARNLIERDRPLLIVESNGDIRVGDLLSTMGYDLFDLSMQPVMPGQVPPNLVAVPCPV
jgi:FkbM family methyltransferase